MNLDLFNIVFLNGDATKDSVFILYMIIKHFVVKFDKVCIIPSYDITDIYDIYCMRSR